MNYKNVMLPVIAFAFAYTAIAWGYLDDDDELFGNKNKSSTVVFPVSGSASGTAHTDMFGTTRYVDTNGNSVTAHTDIFGTTHWSDNNGNSGTAHTDIFGTTRWSDNNGNSGSSHTDIFGTTHWSDNNGNSGTAHTDMFGTTHYNSSSTSTPTYVRPQQYNGNGRKSSNSLFDDEDDEYEW